MTPHFADDHLTVYCGDAATVLATLPAESAHCCITSPPYWGLRDYGTPGQLGLERTPAEYVATLVGVFREVRRVLRDDGTLWLNLGDCYATGAGSYRNPGSDMAPIEHGGKQAFTRDYARTQPNRMPLPGLKPKDLVGIPWRLAFALQADGWYLRSDIIWAKPNPMPESVTDRPTKAHEYVFLLSKAPRYYYDAEAVREVSATTRPELLAFGEERPGVGGTGHMNDRRRSKKPDGWATHPGGHGSFHWDGREAGEPSEIRTGRNLRTVWTIPTEPYPGAHFATFPQRLVEPCVKAGTSERGVCPECGAPWRREMTVGYDRQGRTTNGPRSTDNRAITAGFPVRAVKSVEMTGWRPTCAHVADPVPATVLDPFAGTGTVGLVANRLGRRAVLIDLSMDYMAQLLARNAQAPLGMGA